MCGIAGIITQAPTTPADLACVSTANSRLTHRGPDGAGEFQDSHVALAMRRLSIIDLEGGWQPLYNEDRTLVLVANGEIYNFVELRERLENLGHRFNTNSDCETILHLYEQHGLDCVQYLRGMFAFALWDVKRKRLVLARDRMGEKPLYLYETKGRLFFASELKALLASGLVPFQLDPTAVNLYFHYQYVPEPMTPLKGVRKLDAASLLVIDVEPWKVEERRYWRMEDAPPLQGEPATLIREQLEAISQIVIRSDVPVGVALSGGLDSSAIAALAARSYPGTMHAFSVGYAGSPDNDERADARALADHIGIPFHDVEVATDEMVDFFPELVYWRDDPIADIAGYGYYAVMKLARENGVPVVLQGQGGDELFWGYPWVRKAAQDSARKLSAGRAGRRGLISQYLKLHAPKDLTRLNFGEWAHDLGGLRTSWSDWRRDRTVPSNQLLFYDLVSDFQTTAKQMRRLFQESFIDELNGSDAAGLFAVGAADTQLDVLITRLICDTYLRENGVTQGDRLSMASSIELRLPLLDYQLVETVIGLRKFHSDVGEPAKAWFKETIKDLLPDWVMHRPKRGFSPPTVEWHCALFAAFGHHLADGYLVQNHILNPVVARELSTGPFPVDAITPLSFKALVLEYWCRKMLEK